MRTFLLLTTLLLLLPACSDGNSRRRTLRARNTSGTASGAIDPVVGGKWLVYFSNETLMGAAGEDRNGDGDMADEIAVAVRADKKNEFFLDVAARGAAVVADSVYLWVDEAEDGRDWNLANGMGDHVLLHWSAHASVLTFVDVLPAAPLGLRFVTVDERLYYEAEVPALAGDETNLHKVFPGEPTVARVVENQAGAGPLVLGMRGEDVDLIHASADEAATGADLNGDGDSTDGFVLTLLNAEDGGARALVVPLAMRDAGAPVHAYRRGSERWDVGVLVDEAAQGGTNLNDPALFAFPTVPAACAGAPDADTADQVLFHLNTHAFRTSAEPPVNSGIAGRDRVVGVEDYFGTLADEADVGCDLNGDGDTVDTVVRWIGTRTGDVPPVDPALFRAVDTSVPGGVLGFEGLFNRFVAVVDEAQDGVDIDGEPADHSLVGWIGPRDQTPAWTFSHSDGDRAFVGTGVFQDVDGDGLGDAEKGRVRPFAGAVWMGPRDLGRVPLAFPEAIPGTDPLVPSLNVNLGCDFLAKDADLVDLLPIWLDFEKRVLDFDGIGFAVDTMHPEVEFGGFNAFFRVRESEDGYDHNGDGAMDDVVLVTNPFTTCRPRCISTASETPGPPIFTDDVRAAAFYADETMENFDFNGDGDTLDLVVRYVEF